MLDYSFNNLGHAFLLKKIRPDIENATHLDVQNAALTVIPNFNIQFDLVFIDADKKNYSSYFDLVIDKVKSGGLIIADNVLWSGKILDGKTNKDVDTSALISFNTKIKNDNRVEKLLLPIRDGLFLIQKK